MRASCALGALGLVLWGSACAHRGAGGTATAPASVTMPRPATAPSTPAMGQSHTPYSGKPGYLAAARPLYPTREPAAAQPNPCQQRSPACDERLRAVLAALDGQVLAMSTPPTAVEREALRLSLLELTPLLTPYPDVAAERAELGDLTERLATLPPVAQEQARRRMGELTDLIRVQIAAAR